MTEVVTTASDAERIRDAVLALGGVADLHGGAFGEIATYLPGDRVAGIRVDPSGIEVHVVVYLEADITQVAQEVRTTAQALFADRRPCTVVVEDVVAGLPPSDQAPTGDVSTRETRDS